MSKIIDKPYGIVEKTEAVIIKFFSKQSVKIAFAFIFTVLLFSTDDANAAQNKDKYLENLNITQIK